MIPALFLALQRHFGDASWAAFDVKVNFLQHSKQENAIFNFSSFRDARQSGCKEVTRPT